MSIISLEKICKKFDDKIIFQNFCLEIDKGAFVSVMGASGAGKSTLLNIIGLLEKPDSGEIIIHGVKNANIYNKDGRILLRNNIAYLFQNYGLIENETVFYNMAISARFRKLTKLQKSNTISNALEKVGLSGFESKKVFKLSGGEQQRVALAKIMVKSSDIILADEPTGSLDDNNKVAILEILRNMNREGKTVIVVTHDEVVSQYASKKINI
ncbi:MAG: putative bacteriocin export ABC transporter [Oscillospiraceae bacterium]|jgi:putative ABC transport system ATP-binding protein|nr:putative bacteriocin export ABC transporter [Oscillospiraceae bacterium]